MRQLRLVYLVAATGLLVACTPPPDSPTRMGPAGPEIQLNAPRTCLNGRCISYIPTTGNVFAPDRITIAVPRAMLGPDRFMTVADFNRLVRLANDAEHINASRPSF